MAQFPGGQRVSPTCQQLYQAELRPWYVMSSLNPPNPPSSGFGDGQNRVEIWVPGMQTVVRESSQQGYLRQSQSRNACQLMDG